MSARCRTAALLEVLGVYLAGPLVVDLLVRVSGIRIVNPLETFTAAVTDSQLVTASRQMFVLLVLQYIGYFAIIIPINWWHRRRGPAAYGVTRAGWSWLALLAAGVGTVAMTTVIVWPASTLLLLDSAYHLNLGGTVPWRQAFFDTSWRRWEFWLFSAVMSWALIPVVEELFFRGYCQRRLAEDWGDGPAIVGTACLFTFTYGQYLALSIYNLSLVLTLFVLAIGFGTVFAWTRSLVPAMIAHAIIDVPATPLWQGVVLVVFVVGGIFVWRRGIRIARQVFATGSIAVCAALAIVGTGWAVASHEIDSLVYVAIAMIAVAIVIETTDRETSARAGAATLRT